MGRMNQFRSLKTYGTKIITFQQEKLIKESEQQIDNTDWDWVKNGVCVALVMMWLKEALDSKYDFFIPKTDPFYGYQGNAAVEAIPTFRKYQNKLLADKNNYSAAKVAASDFQLSMGPKSSVEQFGVHSSRIKNSLPSAKAIYVNAVKRGTNACHALGFFHESNITMVLFDPNVGSWRIEYDELFAFLIEYEKLLGEHSYGACWWSNVALEV